MERLWVTGYRNYELGIFKDDDPKKKVIEAVLKKEMIQAIESGTKWFITGAQLGIEQWGVEVADQLKSDYPNEFKLAVMLPFEEFGEQWNDNNQLKLARTIQKADFSTTVSKQPYHSPQQLRNYQEFMLMHTDGALMIYDNDNPGKPKYDYQAIEQFQIQHDYLRHLIDFDDLQEAAIEYQQNHRK